MRPVGTIRFRVSSVFHPWLALFALFAAGCGGESSSLTTHPVDGRVFYKGGQPVRAGQIRFIPVEDSSYSVAGDIGQDGTFSLTTNKDGKNKPGAVAGSYRVSIQLPSVNHRYVPEIVLTRQYKVEARDNHFEIEIDPPKKPG
jgi:hypothetical protein